MKIVLVSDIRAVREAIGTELKSIGYRGLGLLSCPLLPANWLLPFMILSLLPVLS